MTTLCYRANSSSLVEFPVVAQRMMMLADDVSETVTVRSDLLMSSARQRPNDGHRVVEVPDRIG
jgi:hypothetical protein